MRAPFVSLILLAFVATACATAAPPTSAEGEPASTPPTLDAGVLEDAICGAFDEMFVAYGNPDTGWQSEAWSAFEAALVIRNPNEVRATANVVIAHLQTAAAKSEGVRTYPDGGVASSHLVGLFSGIAEGVDAVAGATAQADAVGVEEGRGRIQQAFGDHFWQAVEASGELARQAGIALRLPCPPETEPTPVPTASPQAADHRIGVRVVDGDGEFFDTESGDRFVPRGANLIRLDPENRGHSTFVPGRYDAVDLAAQLDRLALLGYNVVRVFLEDDGDDPSSLSPEYYENLVGFLHLARERGVWVMVTSEVDEVPMEAAPGVEGHNVQFLAPDGVAVSQRFFGTLLDELMARDAPLETVWAYELRNELFFEALHEPFSLESSDVRTAYGRTYDLSDPRQRQEMMDEGLVHWADTLREEIQRRDPEALVTIGFFGPQGPNPIRPDDTRIIETRAVIERSSLDFVDLHAYPGVDGLTFAQLMENYGVDGPVAKPLVIGEIGAFRHAYERTGTGAAAIAAWQADSCAFGFDGWLTWTWDSGAEQPELWHGSDGDPPINDLLSPVRRPDPCAPYVSAAAEGD